MEYDGTPEFERLNFSICKLIFEIVSFSSLRGFIFAFIWVFAKEKQYVEFISDFLKNNLKVYFVEL